MSVIVLTLWVAPPKMFCIGSNGAYTNCGIANFRHPTDEQLLLLDNFTPNSNYLRSVPLEFLIDLTGLTGFRSMNVLLIDWLTKH